MRDDAPWNDTAEVQGEGVDPFCGGQVLVQSMQGDFGRGISGERWCTVVSSEQINFLISEKSRNNLVSEYIIDVLATSRSLGLINSS